MAEQICKLAYVTSLDNSLITVGYFCAMYAGCFAAFSGYSSEHLVENLLLKVHQKSFAG